VGALSAVQIRLLVMRSLRRATVFLALLLPLCLSAGPVGAGPIAPTRWVWPLLPVPEVVRPFQPPRSPYGPGHRGVDLAGRLGEQVLAIGAGTVAFAGSVAGRGVVVIDHGRLRSTYQPVSATVDAGATLAAGEPLGRLELVHSHCLPRVCLHLGVLRGRTYVDPLTLLGPRPVILKPLGPTAPPAPPPGSIPPLPPRGQAGSPPGFAPRPHIGVADRNAETAGSGVAVAVRGPPGGVCRQARGWACR
jgi:murein DD-endopeptidase MepM/ murein hydrolase activator NlpD